MRLCKLTLSCGLVLMGWNTIAVATDVIVICHTSVSLKPDEIRDVYFGDKGFAGSIKLAPADNSAVQTAFLEKVMRLDAKKYAGIWIKKSFRDGTAAPPLRANDAEALAYVKQTPGACSYIGSPPGDGVVIIATF
jgi:hypothetical protein